MSLGGSCFRYRGDGQELMLQLHVQPAARMTEVSGLHDGALKIRLAAPAADGQANACLVAYLACMLGVAKAQVTIASGAQGRRKRVVVQAPRLPADALWKEA